VRQDGARITVRALLTKLRVRRIPSATPNWLAPDLGFATFRSREPVNRIIRA
jgi:hypothetical protein